MMNAVLPNSGGLPHSLLVTCIGSQGAWLFTAVICGQGCPAGKLTTVLVACLTDALVAAPIDSGRAAHAHAVHALAPDCSCFGAGGAVGAGDGAAQPCHCSPELLQWDTCQYS